MIRIGKMMRIPKVWPLQLENDENPLVFLFGVSNCQTQIVWISLARGYKSSPMDPAVPSEAVFGVWFWGRSAFSESV